MNYDACVSAFCEGRGGADLIQVMVTLDTETPDWNGRGNWVRVD